ncbi:ACP S-malonyltransferase [Patulibacter brassicae]|uniref:[acyl-carrier-protein] S-malonyltransferase n=1 Tax=Patulibacter brassicae TaxID=1705717 RepID=A0ABU4VM24_9ACTN|nr:ACP S-malonyltransferase [Patulibacter brassicae]MDX8152860.1 ACP S-malonyltransferase [Patulibacter brassicae]
MTTAILLPGQGTPMEGARDEVARLRPDLLDAVVDAVGEDPFPGVQASTRFAQPAIVCSSLARHSALDLPRPDAFFGHSLGEIVALALGGAITELEALRLAAARGAAMADADPDGLGSMAALRKGGIEAAEELAAAHDLVVACDNAPGQVILAGRISDLDAAAETAKAAGNRVRRLDVAGAFHSPLMVPATPGLQAAIDGIAFQEPHTTVWSAVTAAPATDPAKHLIDGLTHPVLFRPGLLALHAAGFRRFVDVGPGDVVAGLARRTFPAEEHADVEVDVPQLPAVAEEAR